MKVRVKLVEGMQFIGETHNGKGIVFDSVPENGGKGTGFLPFELLPVALAGCTAFDVISILRKMKEQVTDFEVEVEFTRTEEHPKIMNSITLIYRIYGHDINSANVEKAISLSEEKYCSVQAQLRPSVKIEHKYEIIAI